MLRVQRAATGVVRPCVKAIQVPHGGLQQKQFHDSCISLAKSLPPRTKVEERDIEETFVTGSGPGGQKINKTSSAVRLLHKPTGLNVKVQDSRSQEQNRKIARQRLGEIVQYHEKGDESRMALKIKAKVKKKASARKKTLRKYRMLDELKQVAAESSASAKSSAVGSESDGTKASTAESDADGAKASAAEPDSKGAKSGAAVS